MKLRSEDRCGAAVKRQKSAGMYTRMASESRIYGKNYTNKERESIIYSILNFSES